jgi:hypothetical protein
LNNPRKKLKSICNIYLNLNDNKKNNNNKNKNKSIINEKTKKSRPISTINQKNNKNRNKSRSRSRSRKNNYYNMKKIDYIMKRNNYHSLNKYKKSSKNKKNKNPTLTYFEKIKNEIFQLNKENEIIENKYKNLPISNDELIDIIYRKTHNFYNNSFYDFKKNSEKIKKNIGLISSKIIDDLLYECIGDLTYIEQQKSENDEKKKLMNKFKITQFNLEQYNEHEKILISK